MNDSKNYRAIALGSIVGKGLDHIIMFKNIDALCTSELQFGFKPGHSTSQCTFLLNEIVDMYDRNDSSLYLVFLDASQAFDRVNYCKLFKSLLTRNMCNTTLRFLIRMYTTQCLRVKWNSHVSSPFTCSNGVKQGGVLSPILFCIYMDELLNELEKSGVGCHMGNTFYGALCYADDLTLICPSRRSTEVMLKICEDFASTYGLKFNSSKSVLLTYNVESQVVFVLHDEPIVESDNTLHLGHFVGKMADTKNVSLGVNSLITSANTMLSKFQHCSSDVQTELFASYCTSFYGSVLWLLNDKNIDRMYVMWRKIVRRIWKVPYRTHCSFLPVLMASEPLHVQLLCRLHKFYINLSHSFNSRLLSAYNMLVYSYTNVAMNVKYLMYMLNGNWNDLQCDRSRVKDRLSYKNHIPIDELCLANAVQELCISRDIGNCIYERSEACDLIEYLCCI